MVELTEMMAERMKCLCDLSKVESQSYKEMGQEASTDKLSHLVKPLFNH